MVSGLVAEHGAKRRKPDRAPAAPKARGHRERGCACGKQRLGSTLGRLFRKRLRKDMGVVGHDHC